VKKYYIIDSVLSFSIEKSLNVGTIKTRLNCFRNEGLLPPNQNWINWLEEVLTGLEQQRTTEYSKMRYLLDLGF